MGMENLGKDFNLFDAPFEWLDNKAEIFAKRCWSFIQGMAFATLIASTIALCSSNANGKEQPKLYAFTIHCGNGFQVETDSKDVVLAYVLLYLGRIDEAEFKRLVLSIYPAEKYPEGPEHLDKFAKCAGGKNKI